jgi:hypothetical protein
MDDDRKNGMGIPIVFGKINDGQGGLQPLDHQQRQLR